MKPLPFALISLPVIDLWAETLTVKFGIKNRTVPEYVKDVQIFVSWVTIECPDLLPFKAVQKARRTTIMKYVEWMQKERNLAESSIRRRITTVKIFYDFLIHEKLVHTNPVKDFKHKPKTALPKVMQREQIQDIISEVGGAQSLFLSLRNVAMIELMYASGIRRAELVGIKLDDIDLTERRLFIRQGKGAKDRVVFFNKTAAKAIKEYLKIRNKDLKLNTSEIDDKSLFVSRHGKQLSTRQLWGIFKSALDKIESNGRVSLHSLRHSFATHMLEGGADLETIRKLMGHQSIESTQRYLSVSNAQIGRVYDQAQSQVRKGLQTITEDSSSLKTKQELSEEH